MWSSCRSSARFPARPGTVRPPSAPCGGGRAGSPGPTSSYHRTPQEVRRSLPSQLILKRRKQASDHTLCPYVPRRFDCVLFPTLLRKKASVSDYDSKLLRSQHMGSSNVHEAASLMFVSSSLARGTSLWTKEALSIQSRKKGSVAAKKRG
jgi:hypothetical protein